MKKCTICGKEKDEKEYYYRNKKAERLHAQCKECYRVKRRKIWKEYYNKHGSKYRENAVMRNRELKIILRSRMYDYLQGKSCEKCGISDPRVLEFDHIDPKTKDFSIAKAMHDIMSWDKLLAEIQKCQILCANCHKIKTAAEQGWYKHLRNYTDNGIV